MLPLPAAAAAPGPWRAALSYRGRRTLQASRRVELDMESYRVIKIGEPFRLKMLPINPEDR